jgi:hypothetical protein
VKNPAYADTRYVVDLVASGVVNTMPEATLRAVADHREIPATSIRDHYVDAQQVLDGLAAVGVGYDDVVQQLEDEGVAKFDASWDQLGKQLAIALRQHAGAGLTRSPPMRQVVIRHRGVRASGVHRRVRCRLPCPAPGRRPPHGLSRRFQHCGGWFQGTDHGLCGANRDRLAVVGDVQPFPVCQRVGGVGMRHRYA